MGVRDAAFYSRYLASVESLAPILRAGAAPEGRDEQGRTLLHHAVMHFPEEVGLVLRAGADPNARDLDGKTPLHLAAGTSKDTTILLLAAGADPNARNMHGETPLHLAAARCWENVQVLLDAGADPRAKDGRGRLPEDEIADDSDRSYLAEAKKRLRAAREAKELAEELEAQAEAGKRRRKI